ncbi:ChrR Cupin-like domain-containing protein [Colwellia chukchiensis]|uniref:ChrR Cupin-like domain-containing protein n=1 Tax=Colwellia chukchiensis TaxID=641665 RepID=A0A1H7K5G5_9GAMM|nr:cupin domain-containing protein [Colwellia chukchiensis]SEK81177.1 ChrR Cupin-like domain-containing protein [Colwellia chukchiensis]
MARAHVEFIQSQVLDWQPWPYQQGVVYKQLSVDAETQATTGIFKYSAGWLEQEAYWLDSEEEFFVLKGEITINGVRYGEGYYGYFPANYLRKTLKANKDTVIIRFIDQSPKAIKYQCGDLVPEVTKAAIEGINTFDMHWDKGELDKKLAHLDFGRKILRIDDTTKAKTFLYMVSPQTYPPNWCGPREHHPTVEESFCVTGTLAGNHGVMRTGAYFWRPPGIPHGPYGSRTGCVLLIRFVGGEHINHWSDENYPFIFDAKYAPVLPDNMLLAGKKEWLPEPF